MDSITQYAFFKRLTAMPFIEAIYLYGSRARGDGQPRTDIDLAISCPTADTNQWAEIRRVIEEADTLLKIDCVRYDQIESQSLLTEINRDKVTLYAK